MSSWAVARNAQVRAAAAGAFPGVKFSVRAGSAGRAAVTWLDGPTRPQLQEVLGELADACVFHRDHSLRLVAAATVRAVEAGRPAYLGERGQEPRRVWPLQPEFESSRTAYEFDVSPQEVSPTQWSCADVALALADRYFLSAPMPTSARVGMHAVSDSERTWTTVRVVHHAWPLIRATLGLPASRP